MCLTLHNRLLNQPNLIMMAWLTVNDDALKRYKQYPPEHFSTLRGLYQRFIVSYIIKPFLKWKYPYRYYGHHNTPKHGPFIIAANHITMLDPLLIACAVHHPMAYMAKKELFKNRIAAEFYFSNGCFALDREKPDSSTLKTTLNVLKSPGKWALSIFPEGTRGEVGHIQPLKPGSTALAKKHNMPILPVGITRNEKGLFIITVGEVITDVQSDTLHETLHKSLCHLIDLSWERQN